MEGALQDRFEGHLSLPADTETATLENSELCKENDSVLNDAFFYEKFLLDDLDSYWDDLNVRLIVSRMVTNAVIKGIVNAVVEEASENVAAKEDELAVLSTQLRYYKNVAVEVKTLRPSMDSEFQHIPFRLNCSSSPSSFQLDFSKHFTRLKAILVEHLERVLENFTNREVLFVIDGSIVALRKTLDEVFGEISMLFSALKAELSDCQWENEFQREIDSIAFANSFKGFHDEFEVELFKQRSSWNSLGQKWRRNVDELYGMREELEAMLRVVSVSEPGSLSSHSSFDSLEEWNTPKNKDNASQRGLRNYHPPYFSHPDENGFVLDEKYDDYEKTMIEVSECTELNTMTKEEALAYYRNEMIKMRRQHDSALQEKTEELFRLKREFLKEKGTLHLRREREFESLRRKIPYLIWKLEGVLNKNEIPPFFRNDYLEKLKERADAFYFKNQQLRGLLACRREEIMCLSTQVTDAANQLVLHSSIKADLSAQISKLRFYIEERKIEETIREEIFKTIFWEFACERKFGMGDVEIENEIVQQVLSVLLGGITDDAVSSINCIISRNLMETASFEELLVEKEKELIVVIQENEKLKRTVTSLSMMIEVQEKSELEARSKLTEHQRMYESSCEEIYTLRGQLNQQEMLFSETKKELDLTKTRLNESLQENACYEEESKKLEEQIKQADFVCEELTMLKAKLSQQEMLISTAETELELTKNRLNLSMMENTQCQEDINKLKREIKMSSDALEEAEKQNAVLRIIEERQKALNKSEVQENHQDYTTISMRQFSKAIVDLENKLTHNIERADARLSALTRQCAPLLHQVTLCRKKESWYKRMLEIRWSNLQKAEAEVDLLGDEVDALLGLLGKIYIALDHYSPILQHYPGVVEILKLVERELRGENTKLK